MAGLLFAERGKTVRLSVRAAPWNGATRHTPFDWPKGGMLMISSEVRGVEVWSIPARQNDPNAPDRPALVRARCHIVIHEDDDGPFDAETLAVEMTLPSDMANLTVAQIASSAETLLPSWLERLAQNLRATSTSG
jgi:hypothetical protein